MSLRTSSLAHPSPNCPATSPSPLSRNSQPPALVEIPKQPLPEASPLVKIPVPQSRKPSPKPKLPQVPSPKSPVPVAQAKPAMPQLAALPKSTPIVADTGCTGHFLSSSAPYTQKRPADPSISVRLPNGSTMRSSHIATLDIPSLPASACEAHIFPRCKPVPSSRLVFSAITAALRRSPPLP